MVIIAESGSTKTDWCIYNPSKGSIVYKKTAGINPYFSNEVEVLACLKTEFDEIDINEINEVYFYGPGCSMTAQKDKLKRWLKYFFTHAVIEVETDLLAAGRSVFQETNGIVCILGTGSNSGVYSDGQIIETLPSLGYLFGDEGSGAHIGKKLLSDFLNDELPPIIKELFAKTYNLGYKEILNNVYSGAFPSRFLATFTQFVYDNINIIYCKTLVDNSLEDFFIKRLTKYPGVNSYPIKFVGSVAFAFSAILSQVALRHDIVLDVEKDIVKAPIEGLIRYHLK